MFFFVKGLAEVKYNEKIFLFNPSEYVARKEREEGSLAVRGFEFYLYCL